MLDFDQIKKDVLDTTTLIHEVEEQVNDLEIQRPPTSRVRKPMIKSTDIFGSEREARENAWRESDGSLRPEGIHSAEIRSQQQALINKVGK